MRVGELDAGLVLSPLRYGSAPEVPGVPLGALVESVRTSVSPRSSPAPGSLLVLDTTHARDGLLDVDAAAASTAATPSIGSLKRLTLPGDVLVSRLRPYLRQVAWIDARASAERPVCCSTEFYVLRSRDGSSIAFLVPWLLSPSVQSALAAAQEGGHHPRVNEETLLRLPVPHAVLERRDELSALVEEAAEAYRAARGRLAAAAAIVDGTGG